MYQISEDQLSLLEKQLNQHFPFLEQEQLSRIIAVISVHLEHSESP